MWIRTFRTAVAALLFALLSAAVASCARDKAGPEGPAPEAVEIVLHYVMRADISPELYYFLIFDFSEPNISETIWEAPKISGDERGAGWERYMVFHGNAPTTSKNSVYTLEREELPALVPVGTGPNDIISVQLNDDEYPDLVTADKLGNTVSVLLGTDQPTFEAAVSYPTGNVPVGLISTDYDGDGDKDVLVANFEDTEEGRSVSILLNDGAGVLSDGGTISLPAQPSALALADFTGDGRDDLVVALYTDSEAGNKIAVLPRTDEGFGEPIETPAGKNPVDLAVVDWGSDGVNDLFVLNGFNGEDGNSVMLLTGNTDGEGNPDATFTLTETLATGAQPASIALERLNEDEVPDIVVANGYDGEGGNSLSVFLSAEEGGYEEPLVIPVGPAPAKVLVMDLNGDGILDLIDVESANTADGNRVRTLLGDGEGGYGNESTAPTGRSPQSAVLLDFSGDGQMDLAVPNSFNGGDGNSVALLTGAGDGKFLGVMLYWTDELPHSVATEFWVPGINIGRNYIEVRLDAQQFTDLDGKAPDKFLVEFLTATTGVDKDTNPLDEGIELDWLLRPVLVSVEAGFDNDEQRMNLETVENTPEPPPEEADIIDWWVEVK